MVILGSTLRGLALGQRLARYGVAAVVIRRGSTVAGPSRAIDGLPQDARLCMVSGSELSKVLDPAGFAPYLRYLDRGVVLRSGHCDAAIEAAADEPRDLFPIEIRPDRGWGEWLDEVLQGAMATPQARSSLADPLYALMSGDVTGRASVNSAAESAGEWLWGGAMISGGTSLLYEILGAGLDVRSGSSPISMARDGARWLVNCGGLDVAAAMVIVGDAELARDLGLLESADCTLRTTFWYACHAPNDSKKVHLGWAQANRVLSAFIAGNVDAACRSHGESLVVATVVGDDPMKRRCVQISPRSMVSRRRPGPLLRGVRIASRPCPPVRGAGPRSMTIVGSCIRIRAVPRPSSWVKPLVIWSRQGWAAGPCACNGRSHGIGRDGTPTGTGGRMTPTGKGMNVVLCHFWSIVNR